MNTMKKKRRGLPIIVALALLLGVLVPSLKPIEAYAAFNVSGTKPAEKGGTGQSDFENNKGKYSSYEHLAFAVKREYGYRLQQMPSATFSVTPFGTTTTAQYFEDIIVKPSHDPAYATQANQVIFRTSSNTAGNYGIWVRGLQLRQPVEDATGKIVTTPIPVDMKVTVMSVDVDALHPAANSAVTFRDDQVFPNVNIINTKEVELKYEFYQGGTNNLINAPLIPFKTNFTYADIDDNQYIGIRPNDIYEQYLDPYTALAIKNIGSYQVLTETAGINVTGNPATHSWGFAFEQNTLNLVFGNSKGTITGNLNDDEWAHFGQYGNTMDIPPDNPDPKKTVSDSDETDVKNNTLINANETFSYRVYQDVPSGIDPSISAARYTSFVMEDQIDTCLVIDRIRIYNAVATSPGTLHDEWSGGATVDNKAWVSSYSDTAGDSTNPKSASASVYINSPKLNVKKTVQGDITKLDNGKEIHYTVEITNINPGTFMRDCIFSDEIKQKGVKLLDGTMLLFSVPLRYTFDYGKH